MSIGRMYNLAARRETEILKIAGAPAADAVDTTKPPPEGALAKITAFIPTEVLGIYVALLGAFEPTSASDRWWVFAVGAALVPTFLGLNYLINKREGKEVVGGWRLLIVLVLALVAYLTWTAAMPNTPFLACSVHAPKVGAGAVIILSALMPSIARAFGIAPRAG